MGNRYLIRAGKYFIFLLLLFVLLYGMMIAIGQSSWAALGYVFTTNRVWWMAALFVVLPLTYPFFGFVTREVRATRNLDRDTIVRVLGINGFALKSESGDTMVFVPDNFAGRLRMFFEDEIVVVRKENVITVSGIRREVVRAEFRLNSFK